MNMKILLKGIQELEVTQVFSSDDITPKDWVQLDVLYCALCRTDAKLWREGHRDLSLPRVPGHEVAARKDGVNYAVWPGITCGKCKYCLSGDENLCEEMKIIGFHTDGGFSTTICVPKYSLIPLPVELIPKHAVFAEPAGCILNAFRKLGLRQGQRLLIYGAGTVGLLAALLGKEFGAELTILEKSEVKIQKAKQFSRSTSIRIVKETNDSNFDCILIACSDPIAFLSSIPRARKGGKIAHFSGLEKNEQAETNLLNLVHYKELAVVGSYGLTKRDMEKALILLKEIPGSLEMLIEEVISPGEIEEVIPSVLNGETYKYIIDVRNQDKIQEQDTKSCNKNYEKRKYINVFSTNGFLEIPVINEKILSAAQEKIDNKTKPLGALGKLEELAVRMSIIQNTLNPRIKNKALFVFAADHGIAEEGVSVFPQEVTRQMVENFLNKGAAINVLSSFGNIELSVINMGIKGDTICDPGLIDKNIAKGTKNFALQPAMTIAEAQQALGAGKDIFLEKYKQLQIDIIGLGEMGIGNTTSAAAIISVITGKPIHECTGRGTGIDDKGLEHKIKILKKALKLHNPANNNAIEVLSKVGGFEIAGMAGAMLAAASKRCAIVLDGLISTAAGLVAYLINPQVANYMIAGHKSVEQGHILALKFIGIKPVLDLNMRLGEGTGAALTISIVDAACNLMIKMASFEEAGITNCDNNK